jgi:hypothetical protein
MNARGLVFTLCACRHPQPPPSSAPATSIARPAHSCSDAAHGLGGATRGVRDPESPIIDELAARCASDGWPADARDCFAVMREGELERCAGKLSPDLSTALLALLGEQTSLEQARAQLASITVGIVPCDAYLAAVRKALDCNRLAVDVRAQLGAEEANFWSIPMGRLDAAGKQQIAERCVRGLEQLRAAVDGLCVL